MYNSICFTDWPSMQSNISATSGYAAEHIVYAGLEDVHA